MVKFIVPKRGFSSPGAEGGALHDPDSDHAFIQALKESLDKAIEIIEVDTDINTKEFARCVAHALDQTLPQTEGSEKARRSTIRAGPPLF